MITDLLNLHAVVSSHLGLLIALRGVGVFSLDDQQAYRTINAALDDPRGAAVAVGNPNGTLSGSNIPGGDFNVTTRLYVFENQAITRNRPLAATVANAAARLALTGVALGAKVHQTDVNLDYWLMNAGHEVDPLQWAEVLVATQILERCVRAMQLFAISPNQTVVVDSFEPGNLDDIHNYMARISLLMTLDPTPVT